ncbi:MAG TPA: M48 family metalloprotease, partial [Vicinamibacterales bacterium]|nr:M48 family metalloprotease [Vicinamibacterales bacterium]
MNEDKATRYHRLGRRAAMLSTVGTGLILAGLLFLGGSAALRDRAASIAGSSPTLTIAFYILVLSILIDVATLPLSYYRGFLLERRYGLSTETRQHWFKDHVKAVAIGVLFAEAAGVFVYFTLRHWPEWWWLVAGAGYSLVTIVLVNLAPVVLLPLFFTFKPLQKEVLCDRLQALASKAGTRVMGVYEWTLSDRTKKANAALTGIGHTRRILLSDTLLADYSDDEIEVILAHELAHHVHHDIWSGLAVEAALIVAGFFAADVLLAALWVPLGLAGKDDLAALPLLLLVGGGLSVLVMPLFNAFSRA